MSLLDVDRSASLSPNYKPRGYFPSAPLSHSHISEALASSQDNGATLAFMKKGFTELSQEAIEELATIGMGGVNGDCYVKRIALGCNRLSTVPMEFALLSRLRYLNLRSNSFTTFPDVLTVMKSLDTLDISHNRIKRLPSQPGTLVNLRVFCFSRNKITRLPKYLPLFHKLNVLELDRNPIEWPPRSVLDRPTKFPDAEAAKEWIRSVKHWIDAENSRARQPYDDSGFSEQIDLESRMDEISRSWSRLSESEVDEGITPHARSFSIDSTFSTSSIAESEFETQTPSSSFGQQARPPLHLGILQTYSNESSPTRSIESYLPSPAESIRFFEDNSTAGTRHDDGSQPSPTGPLHGRNASYAAVDPQGRKRVDLSGKKSMPDLRTAKLNFSKKVPDVPERGILTPVPSRSRINDDFSMPSPQSQRQDSGSSASSGPKYVNQPITKEPLQFNQTSPTRAVPSMNFERNSYFRRFSTLPTTTVTSILPASLLSFIDSVRSILFAASQIYQALEHYTIHAIDERLSSVLRKVLDLASADMMQLINSLDRFDVMSRKMVPPPSICRGVVESCKDTVAAFTKAVGVLQLQLKVICNGDDVRFLRWLLLVLYGASSEITYAWQSAIPQIDAIRPLLHSKSYPNPSPPGLLTGASASPAGPKPFQLDQPPSVTYRSNGHLPSHTARRHAGSFSYKDVEIGKKLPSIDEPTSSRGLARTHLTKRSQTMAAASPSTPIPLSSSTSVASIAESARSMHHSRSESQASLQASSSSSSPSMVPKTTFLELPSSKMLVDKEALYAVQDAINVAPIVWDMMEETLSDVLDNKTEIQESLELARTVTQRLANTIQAINDGDSNADRKALRDDAHIFLKTVIQLSSAIKTYGVAPSQALRTNMVKLTNSTQEFAILLHVSSLSPSATSRQHSPLLGPSPSQTSLVGGSPEDNRPANVGLSRSRSAQPTVSSLAAKPTSPVPPSDGSRSALPLQTFKLPMMRLRGRDAGNDPG